MRYFTTKSGSLFRDYPWLMFVGAVINGVVLALLVHSDGYTMSAAVGRGAAVAALTFAGFLAIRWVEERLAARRATGNGADNPKASSLTGDAA